MQAKDISDLEFLRAIAAVDAVTGLPGGWTMRWDVSDHLNVPEKVAIAKYLKCEKRGLVAGCGCGCRGDWHLTLKGERLLAAS